MPTIDKPAARTSSFRKMRSLLQRHFGQQQQQQHASSDGGKSRLTDHKGARLDVVPEQIPVLLTKPTPPLLGDQPPSPPATMHQPDLSTILDELKRDFEISTEKMQAIVSHFIQEMQKGLDAEGATVAMIPSFVTGRPTGSEQGKYLAIDLGGTHLRVCEVDLQGNSQFAIHQQKYTVPTALKTGDIRELCDFIADCVDSFISDKDGSYGDETLQLGFTFSFPIWQTSINRGTLKQWTKGYKCENAVGKDIAVIMQDAFLRKNVPVNVAAIVNDTVGTMMALGYSRPETAMGVILGTGTNACYYEKIKRIKKWTGGDVPFEDMVINIEWGSFDNERAILPMTLYDNKLDRESINPRQQIFEKMLSGMYLGEIARNVLTHGVDRGLLFGGESSAALNRQWSFETSYLSTIQTDSTPDLADTKHILQDILGLAHTSLEDRKVVHRLAEWIGLRAARLSACGLAAVLHHARAFEELAATDDPDVVIGIDGSLFEHYPGFDSNMMQALRELLPAEAVKRVSFEHARDGSGLGAAIIAMMSHKAALAQKNQQQQQQQQQETSQEQGS